MVETFRQPESLNPVRISSRATTTVTKNHCQEVEMSSINNDDVYFMYTGKVLTEPFPSLGWASWLCMRVVFPGLGIRKSRYYRLEYSRHVLFLRRSIVTLFPPLFRSCLRNNSDPFFLLYDPLLLLRQNSSSR
jgi:hypothetical protein